MNDFDYDCYQKKRIASGARHKKASKKGPKGCTLPHEYLSKKEIQKMNGEVKSYNMKEPVAYDEFKSWPDDIKASYLKRLQDEYHASDAAIAHMMGIATGSVIGTWRKIFHIPSLGKGCRVDQEKWEAFLHGPKAEPVEEVPVDIPEEAEEKVIAVPRHLNSFDNIVVDDHAPVPVIHASLEVNANNWDDVLALLRVIDISQGARIGIFVNSEEMEK